MVTGRYYFFKYLKGIKIKILGLHSGIWSFFSCINDLTVLIFFFLAGIIDPALSESIDCLRLTLPFTGSVGVHKGFKESFSSSEQEDESSDVSEVF